MVKCLPTTRETQVQSLGWEDPLERKWQPTPVLLPGKSHGQRGLVGYSLWGCKELDTTKQLTHIHIYLLYNLLSGKYTIMAESEEELKSLLMNVK